MLYDRNVLVVCMTTTFLYGHETIALSERQHHRLQVWEHNWVRWIAGVKRVGRRKMDDLREELGIEKCVMRRLVKSWVKWAGHVERMVEDRRPRMAYNIHQKEGRKYSFGKAYRYSKRREGGEEGCASDGEIALTERQDWEVEDWRTVARGRGRWRRVNNREG